MSINKTTRAISGFTLVELSIVIVIIGFLVAGIAAGASMVKQAQLRSVMVDLQAYQTAYNNFKSAYNGVPGDITSASSFWTAGGQCAVLVANITDCNGNGDGIINVGTAAPGDEVQPALRELALANMISSGIVAVPHGAIPGLVPGVNAGISKITGGGYFLAGGAGSTAGYPSILVSTFLSPFASSTNVVYFGAADGVDNLVGGILVPQDAFNIDQKIDDGNVSGGTFSGATTGSFMAMDGANVTHAADCAATAANGGAYTIATTYNACVVGFALN